MVTVPWSSEAGMIIGKYRIPGGTLTLSAGDMLRQSPDMMKIVPSEAVVTKF